MGSLKSPCTTSYRSSIETIAINCLVFEKIALLSPRLLTEPWRQEERCVRAGENGSPRRFVFSSFTSLFDSFKQAFRHDGNTAFVRTFYYNVTAIRVPAAFAPRGSEPARRGARRLSPVEMSGTKTLTRNTNKKQNQNENATRYIHRLIYCLASVRQRKGRFPGQMPEYHLLNRQWISILPGGVCSDLGRRS